VYVSVCVLTRVLLTQSLHVETCNLACTSVLALKVLMRILITNQK